MFNPDPLSRPVAVVEMLLLLTFAAFIGWVFARLILQNRIHALRSAISDQESELEDCRRSKMPTGLTVEPVRPFIATMVPTPDVLPVREAAESDAISPGLFIAEAPLALAPERPFADPFPAVPEPVMPAPATVTGSGGSEAAILQRIAARAGELNFERIGLASAAEADDLKDIVGIGPFLERKLHSLGIYTFRQVANFGKEDIDKVNEIIEFFPGRIERDNWVDQSRVFYERKYGKPISQ